MAETIIIKLPEELEAELMPLLQQTHTSLNTFIYQAIRAYVTAQQNNQIREQLARDYDALAAMYDELAADLADEVWLPWENEALLRTEQSWTS